MGNHVWIDGGQLKGCDRHKKYMSAWVEMSHQQKFLHALEYCEGVQGSGVELERLSNGMGGEISEAFLDAEKEFKQKSEAESWYQSSASMASGPLKAVGPPSVAANTSPPPPPPPRDARGGPDLLGGAALLAKLEALADRMDSMVQMMERMLETNAAAKPSA